MIKHFIKKRKNLVAEKLSLGRATNYLKYAIVESSQLLELKNSLNKIIPLSKN